LSVVGNARCPARLDSAGVFVVFGLAQLAFTLPQGCTVGLVVGAAIHHLAERGWLPATPSSRS
jgi:hypothetical protein